MTILLDINDFREFVKVPKTLNIKDFENYINLAQERFLKPLLCETTLENLKTAYEAGSLSGNDLNLYNQVKPALVFRAYELWVQESSVIATPQGLKLSEDIDGTSSPLESERRQKLITTYKDNASFFENRLLAFLEKEKETYTAWRDSQCNCVDRRSSNYLHGLSSKKSVQPLKITYSENERSQKGS